MPLPVPGEGPALPGAVGNPGGGLTSDLPSVVSSPLDAVTHIWNTLTSRGLWVRIAEGLIGGALILIAVAHMTGAPSAVKKIAKVIPA